jgi:predicted transcriptional regulator
MEAELSYKYWRVLDHMNLEEWYAPYEIAKSLDLSIRYTKGLLHYLYKSGILVRKKFNFGRASYYYSFPQSCLTYWSDNSARDWR